MVYSYNPYVHSDWRIYNIHKLTIGGRFSVSIVARLRSGRPQNQGSIPVRSRESSPQHLDRSWGPHSVLIIKYRGALSECKSAEVKMTLSPPNLHSVLLN
jgi:hypothetical protein